MQNSLALLLYLTLLVAVKRLNLLRFHGRSTEAQREIWAAWKRKVIIARFGKEANPKGHVTRHSRR